MKHLRTTRFAFSKRQKAQEATWETETAETYEEWLRANFGHVATHPLAERHHRLWGWFASLQAGVRQKPIVIIWPRGGGKSATVELGCAFIATRRPLPRRFVLYVCGTQQQADTHIQSIATLLEQIGVARKLTRYGHSRGWRRNQLITASGFALEALGLDTAIRGIRIDECRPDLIIFDDVDALEDTPKTVEKKLRAITRSILPTGSSDCCSLFAQNLIHEESIASRLHDGRADFLHDRDVPPIEPAIDDLKVEPITLESGLSTWQIVSGSPTWAGQALDVCEAQIREWGLSAFLIEAQHEVEGTQGYFFDYKRFVVVDEAPALTKMCAAWDLAATEGAGDFTVGVLLGLAKNNLVYVLDVIRDQMSSERVRKSLLACANRWGEEYGRIKFHVPQDPGQAGKAQSAQLSFLLRDSGVRFMSLPVGNKRKGVRARGFADCVNSGNVRLLRGDWNREFIQEHKKFREDEEHEFDDQVDAASDAYNIVAGKYEQRWDALFQ